MDNPWNRVAPSPTPRCCSCWKRGAFGLPSTKVANFTFTYTYCISLLFLLCFHVTYALYSVAYYQFLFWYKWVLWLDFVLLLKEIQFLLRFLFLSHVHVFSCEFVYVIFGVKDSFFQIHPLFIQRMVQSILLGLLLRYLFLWWDVFYRTWFRIVFLNLWGTLSNFFFHFCDIFQFS